MTEYTCDSFRFFNLFPVYFGGKGTVLQSENETPQNTPFPGEEAEYSQFDFSRVTNCIRVRPSFEHSTGVLQKNPHLYGVRYLQEEKRISAFCVYAKRNGDLIQMG